MTKKQIILCLLPIYKRTIQRLKTETSVDMAKHVLLLFSVSMGICASADAHLDENISNKKWILRHAHHLGEDEYFYYWDKCPSEGETVEEIISLLQIRVDIMEKELKRKWWHLF